MRTAAIALAGAAVLATLAVAPPAAAQDVRRPGRVYLVLVDGSAPDDWARARIPAVERLARDGASGLVSARDGSPPPTGRARCVERRTAARATLLDGTRRATDPPGGHALLGAMATRGYDLRIVRPEVEDRAFPGGMRFDQATARRELARRFRNPGVTLVPFDDALLADCHAPPDTRERWVALALGRAGSLVSFLKSVREPGDHVIVASTIAPIAHALQRDFLTPIALSGPAIEHGVVTSASTRRTGVVALTDVAPTIATLLGVPASFGTGRPVRVVDGSPAGLYERYARVATVRGPLLRGLVFGGCAVVLVALLLVVAGRGRASGSRRPRAGRDAVAVALGAVVAAPGVTLLEPLAGVRSAALSGAIVGGGAVLVALLARLVAGPRRAIPVIAAATVALVAGDLAAGGPLARRSAISYSIAEGSRFFGIGNELMGVLVACALVWAASALDAPRAPRPAVVAVLAGLAALMVLPFVGAKFGAAFVAVPAFGWLVGGGRRGGARTIVGIAAATTLLAGIAAAADLLAGPDASAHVGRVAGGAGGDVAGRKIGAALRLIAGSYWTAGIVVGAGAVALLAWRRPALCARGTWGRPHLRIATSAAGIAVAGAIAFNDAGVVAASLVALVSAGAFLHALLAEHATPPKPSEALARLREFAR